MTLLSKTRKPLSSYHPALYKLSLFRQRLPVWLRWYTTTKKFAHTKSATHLPIRITKHQSLLIRKLGTTDLQLQYNKIQNLKLATAAIDGVVIQPGETFSVWRLVGEPTAKKGYVEGLLLSHGEASVGIGGGLCQLANLLYWMALHSPLTVTQRYRHSFDAFPDSGRTLPFGSGATLFYNYIDLQLYNPTNQPIQIRTWVTDEHLKGMIQTTDPLKESYSIVERDHQFLTDGNKFYRANKLFCVISDRTTGTFLREEVVCENFCEMKYVPPEGTMIYPIDPKEVTLRSS